MIAADAEIYLRPTAFVDAPFGHDGQVARLAGGMLWFSAVEIIARPLGGKRSAQPLVPVAALDDARASLTADQQATFDRQWAALTAARPALALGNRSLRFDQPSIMAILNITPDSFSDGGAHADPADAAAHAVDMAAAGAAIIDLGGESTRPGAQPVWEGDEIARVQPVLERLRAAELLLSIDTRKASVMEAALAAGGHIVNDVSGLTYDRRSLDVIVASGAPVVIMHTQGDPKAMQDAPLYADAPLDVFDWLADRRDAAIAAGVAAERIILDPGIGFGKSLRHNVELLNHLSLFHALGCPLLLGASRKRLIGALSKEAPVDQRLGGSVALVMAGLAQGVQILRVHDVQESVQALHIWRGLRDVALSPTGG